MVCSWLRMLIIDQFPKQWFPNSIAHVRELLRIEGFPLEFLFSYNSNQSRSKAHGLLGDSDEKRERLEEVLNIERGLLICRRLVPRF